MARLHTYSLTVHWTDVSGRGTENYRSYKRDHVIQAESKPPIFSSADPAFRGDLSRYNPEELLLASLSSCHMLWYLHLCSEAGIVVLDYHDKPVGIMEETTTGGGRFQKVTLYPVVTLKNENMLEQANVLHERAHALCFIANSVNFDVLHVPKSTTTSL